MAKSKVKKMEDCVACLDIEVSKDTIENAFEEVYDELVKVVTIPGFRTGKAPKDLVKKQYAKDAREEVLKRLIPDAYRKAVEEHKITPVGMPDISDLKFDEGKLLSFKARIDTRPEFKLKNYKALKLERKKVDVKAEDIDKTIESLRGVHAKYTDADDRPVAMGDYVIADMDCLVDGKPFHKKRENVWLSVDKESFIPGLGEKLVGMKKLEERDIESALPDKYPDKALAGKKAVYHVKINGIKVRELPNLDDEFAKDLGKENLSALKEEVAKELESRMKASSEIDLENQLLKKLMDDNNFAVPATFVKRQTDFMVENSKRRLEEKGFKREELDKKDDEFRAKCKDDAVRQVRLLFILDEIARAENIEADESDLQNSYNSIAIQANTTAEEVKKHYEKEEMVDNLLEKIREEKTIDFLLKNAEITEK